MSLPVARIGGVCAFLLIVGAAAVVALTAVWTQDSAPSEAAGGPSPDFSMAVTSAGCSTDADPPEDTCEIALDSLFTVRVSLNSLDGLTDFDGDTKTGYDGVQVRLNFPAELTQKGIRFPWPDCSVRATNEQPDTILAGCITPFGGNESVFVGVVAEVDFTCSQSESTHEVEMPHGLVATSLLSESNTILDKDPTELLIIDCSALAPTPTPAPAPPPTPKPIPAVSVGGGRLHSCAAVTSGAVSCWGVSYGTSPVAIGGLASGAGLVEAGAGQTCVLTVSGGVKCFGANGFGQVGDGTVINRPAAVDVVGLASGVSDITAGIGHSCALTTTGRVSCWGLNSSQQLGISTSETCGTSSCSTVPVEPIGLASGVTAIGAGGSRTCAVVMGGVECWGTGFGTQPAPVAGLTSDVADVAVGFFHICALRTSGAVTCLGLSNGPSAGAIAVSAGETQSCALTNQGAVKCWGENNSGQLGDGSLTDRSSPVDVVGIDDAVALGSGASHSCAVTSEGKVKCWGLNVFGKLGSESTTLCQCETTPVVVPGFGINPVGGFAVELGPGDSSGGNLLLVALLGMAGVLSLVGTLWFARRRLAS